MDVALAIILGVIVLIIVLVRFKVTIGLALLLGSLILVLLLNPWSIVEVFKYTITFSRTWFLVTISFSIALLAEFYQATGLVNEMGKALTGIIRKPRLALMLVPGIIGLLPVVGGALMSAPMVDAIAKIVSLSEVASIYVNVWFRHIIFISYPLGQGIIVTSTLTNIPVEQLVLRNLPITLFMAVLGYIIALRGVKASSAKIMRSEDYSIKSLIPFIVSLVLALALRYVIGDYGMSLGVIIGVIVLIFMVKPNVNVLRKIVTSSKVWEITLAAFSIMFFQSALTLTRASKVIANALTSASIPLLVIETVVPYVIAYSLGSIVMAVTLTIPLVQPLTPITIAHASIVYVSAFLGHLGSPTHLCLIYTAEYFKKTFTESYKYLMPSIISSLVFTVVYNMFIP